MIRLSVDYRAELDAALKATSLEDIASVRSVGGVLEVTFPCFSDEQQVSGELDFAYVHFEISKG